ncbi:hypothetical protein F5Y02DRAFT_405679 [Annulohypoxylon stygium]|nr:hypothetical protein F5Y02DRAFT_405679 [Annulohypoxylon stygium]
MDKMEDHERSPISTLSNELLLSIFESELPPSTLLNCMLCCKRWSSLSSSALYKHLVLNIRPLLRFIRSSSKSRDALVETLTLRINPGRYERPDDVLQMESDLFELASRVKDMTNLQVFSFFMGVKNTSAGGTWITNPVSIAAILDSLPQSCAALELDFRYTRRPFDYGSLEDMHLCPSIRKIIPRIRFLRLNLPCICPEAFGSGFDPSTPLDPPNGFKPVEAPHLEECLVKVADPRYTLIFDYSWVCRYQGESGDIIIPIMAKHLQIFKNTSHAPKLKKLWIMDGSPRSTSDVVYEAIIRRDVLAGKSQFLPGRNIGLHKYNKEGIFIRMPEEEGGQDIVSTIQGVVSLAEQHAWVESIYGTRAPAAEVSRKHLTLVKYVMRTPDEWFTMTNIMCTLWQQEKQTGIRLLDVVERGLTETSTLSLRTPDG